MEIVKLPRGETAPEDSDCVSIMAMPDGKYALNCSALQNCDVGDDSESSAVIGGAPYDSYDEAEAAGLAWANEMCTEMVYISQT